MPGYDAWLEAPYNDAAIAEEEFDEAVDMEKEFLYKELAKSTDLAHDIVNDYISDPEQFLAQILFLVARKDDQGLKNLVDEEIDLIAVKRANNGC
jgi:hypothetical protein